MDAGPINLSKTYSITHSITINNQTERVDPIQQ